MLDRSIFHTARLIAEHRVSFACPMISDSVQADICPFGDVLTGDVIKHKVTLNLHNVEQWQPPPDPLIKGGPPEACMFADGLLKITGAENTEIRNADHQKFTLATEGSPWDLLLL